MSSGKIRVIVLQPCSIGNFMRTLAMPDTEEARLLTSLREKVSRIGASVAIHGF